MKPRGARRTEAAYEEHVGNMSSASTARVQWRLSMLGMSMTHGISYLGEMVIKYDKSDTGYHEQWEVRWPRAEDYFELEQSRRGQASEDISILL